MTKKKNSSDLSEEEIGFCLMAAEGLEKKETKNNPSLRNKIFLVLIQGIMKTCDCENHEELLENPDFKTIIEDKNFAKYRGEIIETVEKCIKFNKICSELGVGRSHGKNFHLNEIIETLYDFCKKGEKLDRRKLELVTDIVFEIFNMSDEDSTIARLAAEFENPSAEELELLMSKFRRINLEAHDLRPNLIDILSKEEPVEAMVEMALDYGCSVTNVVLEDAVMKDTKDGIAPVGYNLRYDLDKARKLMGCQCFSPFKKYYPDAHSLFHLGLKFAIEQGNFTLLNDVLEAKGLDKAAFLEAKEEFKGVKMKGFCLNDLRLAILSFRPKRGNENLATVLSMLIRSSVNLEEVENSYAEAVVDIGKPMIPGMDEACFFVGKIPEKEAFEEKVRLKKFPEKKSEDVLSMIDLITETRQGRIDDRAVTKALEWGDVDCFLEIMDRVDDDKKLEFLQKGLGSNSETQSGNFSAAKFALLKGRLDILKSAFDSLSDEDRAKLRSELVDFACAQIIAMPLTLGDLQQVSLGLKFLISKEVDLKAGRLGKFVQWTKGNRELRDEGKNEARSYFKELFEMLTMPFVPQVSKIADMAIKDIKAEDLLEGCGRGEVLPSRVKSCIVTPLFNKVNSSADIDHLVKVLSDLLVSDQIYRESNDICDVIESAELIGKDFSSDALREFCDSLVRRDMERAPSFLANGIINCFRRYLTAGIGGREIDEVNNAIAPLLDFIAQLESIDDLAAIKDVLGEGDTEKTLRHRDRAFLLRKLMESVSNRKGNDLLKRFNCDDCYEALDCFQEKEEKCCDDVGFALRLVEKGIDCLDPTLCGTEMQCGPSIMDKALKFAIFDGDFALFRGLLEELLKEPLKDPLKKLLEKLLEERASSILKKEQAGEFLRTILKTKIPEKFNKELAAHNIAAVVAIFVDKCEKDFEFKVKKEDLKRFGDDKVEILKALALKEAISLDISLGKDGFKCQSQAKKEEFFEVLALCRRKPTDKISAKAAVDLVRFGGVDLLKDSVIERCPGELFDAALSTGDIDFAIKVLNHVEDKKEFLKPFFEKELANIEKPLDLLKNMLQGRVQQKNLFKDTRRLSDLVKICLEVDCYIFNEVVTENNLTILRAIEEERNYLKSGAGKDGISANHPRILVCDDLMRKIDKVRLAKAEALFSKFKVSFPTSSLKGVNFTGNCKLIWELNKEEEKYQKKAMLDKFVELATYFKLEIKNYDQLIAHFEKATGDERVYLGEFLRDMRRCHQALCQGKRVVERSNEAFAGFAAASGGGEKEFAVDNKDTIEDILHELHQITSGDQVGDGAHSIALDESESKEEALVVVRDDKSPLETKKEKKTTIGDLSHFPGKAEDDLCNETLPIPEKEIGQEESPEKSPPPVTKDTEKESFAKEKQVQEEKERIEKERAKKREGRIRQKKRRQEQKLHEEEERRRKEEEEEQRKQKIGKETLEKIKKKNSERNDPKKEKKAQPKPQESKEPPKQEEKKAEPQPLNEKAQKELQKKAAAELKAMKLAEEARKNRERERTREENRRRKAENAAKRAEEEARRMEMQEKADRELAIQLQEEELAKAQEGALTARQEEWEEEKPVAQQKVSGAMPNNVGENEESFNDFLWDLESETDNSAKTPKTPPPKRKRKPLVIKKPEEQETPNLTEEAKSQEEQKTLNPQAKEFSPNPPQQKVPELIPIEEEPLPLQITEPILNDEGLQVQLMPLQNKNIVASGKPCVDSLFDEDYEFVNEKKRDHEAVLAPQSWLCRAVNLGFVKTTKMLLEKGADPDFRALENTGPGAILNVAVRRCILGEKGWDEIVDLLLERGAPVGICRLGLNELHVAAGAIDGKFDLQLFSKLLQQGKWVECGEIATLDARGRTPLDCLEGLEGKVGAQQKKLLQKCQVEFLEKQKECLKCDVRFLQNNEEKELIATEELNILRGNMEAEVERLSHELEMLVAQIRSAQMQNMIPQMQNRITSLEQGNKILSDQVRGLTEKDAKLSAENTALQQWGREMSSAFERLFQERVALDETNQKLFANKRHFEVRARELLEKGLGMKKGLEEEIKNLRRQCNFLKDRNEELRRECASVKENPGLKEENERQKMALEKTRTELSKTQEENKGLRQRLGKLEGAMTVIESALKSTKGDSKKPPKNRPKNPQGKKEGSLKNAGRE